MFKKHEEQISKSIKKYLKKQGRVGFELKQLNQLFKVGGTHLRTFNKIFKSQHQLLPVFKIFLLIHRITIERSQPMQDLLYLLTSLHYQPRDCFEKLLAAKLMQPYRLYLQKRIYTYLEPQTYHRKQQKQMRVYQLINLITLASSFSQIIYTFGRYYMEKFTCSIDFNIILGADLQFVYDDMIQHVNKPATKDILYEIQALHQKMYVIYYNCYFHRYLKGYVPKWVITDLLAHKKFQDSALRTTSKSLSRTAASKVSSFASSKTKNLTPAKVKIVNRQQNLAQSTIFMTNVKVEQEKQENYEQDSILHKSCVYLGKSKNRYVETVLPNNEEESEEETVDNQKNKERFQLLMSMERVVNSFNYL